MSETKGSRFPNLEDVSKGVENFNAERRRLPRLSLGSEQFRLDSNQQIFSVCDLSEHGMGLWLTSPEDVSLFFVGLEISGTLNLQREKYPVEAEVKNIGLSRIGCEFKKLPKATATVLARFLNPKVLGSQLKPIPSSEKNALWYHGPSGTDLILYRSTDGRYRKLVVYVYHFFVQWDLEAGLSTGETQVSSEKSDIRGILRFESYLFKPDGMPDPQKLTIAKTIILSSNLSQDLKTWCVRQFER